VYFSGVFTILKIFIKLVALSQPIVYNEDMRRNSRLKTQLETKGANMATYQINKPVLDRDYTGCGKAWAAISSTGEVLAIRYMDSLDYRHGCEFLPKWIQAVDKSRDGLDESLLPTIHSSKSFAAMAQAAEAAGDCPSKPRGGRYRPNELLTMARAALAAANKAAFLKYREETKAELAKLGHVVSGTCSCTEFVAQG
jgi:hypothetical protein